MPTVPEQDHYTSDHPLPSAINHLVPMTYAGDLTGDSLTHHVESFTKLPSYQRTKFGVIVRDGELLMVVSNSCRKSSLVAFTAGQLLSRSDKVQTRFAFALRSLDPGLLPQVVRLFYGARNKLASSAVNFIRGMIAAEDEIRWRFGMIGKTHKLFATESPPKHALFDGPVHFFSEEGLLLAICICRASTRSDCTFRVSHRSGKRYDGTSFEPGWYTLVWQAVGGGRKNKPLVKSVIGPLGQAAGLTGPQIKAGKKIVEWMAKQTGLRRSRKPRGVRKAKALPIATPAVASSRGLTSRQTSIVSYNMTANLATTFTVLSSDQITPLNATMFPLEAVNAARFDEYRIKKLELHYKTLLPSITPVSGMIGFSYYGNPLSSNPTTSQGAMLTTHVAGHPLEPRKFVIPCDHKWRYTGSGTTGNSAIALYEGLLVGWQDISEHTSGQQLAQVSLTYEIEYRQPIDPSVVGQASTAFANRSLVILPAMYVNTDNTIIKRAPVDFLTSDVISETAATKAFDDVVVFCDDGPGDINGKIVIKLPKTYMKTLSTNERIRVYVTTQPQNNEYYAPAYGTVVGTMSAQIGAVYANGSSASTVLNCIWESCDFLPNANAAYDLFPTGTHKQDVMTQTGCILIKTINPLLVEDDIYLAAHFPMLSSYSSRNNLFNVTVRIIQSRLETEDSTPRSLSLAVYTPPAAADTRTLAEKRRQPMARAAWGGHPGHRRGQEAAEEQWQMDP